MTATRFTIDVQLSDGAMRDGISVAVIFRRWGGAPEQEVVGAVAASAGGPIPIEVGEPGVGVRSGLPPALGGPWAFAIGYVVAYEGTEDVGDGRRIVAVAPEHRVLWIDGPFPAEAFGRTARDPSIGEAEWERLVAGLAALPVGLSLARTTLMRRSLVGFVAASGEVVSLDPARSLEWPTAIF